MSVFRHRTAPIERRFSAARLHAVNGLYGGVGGGGRNPEVRWAVDNLLDRRKPGPVRVRRPPSPHCRTYNEAPANQVRLRFRSPEEAASVLRSSLLAAKGQKRVRWTVGDLTLVPCASRSARQPMRRSQPDQRRPHLQSDQDEHVSRARPSVDSTPMSVGLRLSLDDHRLAGPIHIASDKRLHTD